jgi:hypothetical protein
VIGPSVAAALTAGVLRLALGAAVTWDLSVGTETRGTLASLGEPTGEVTAEPRAALGIEGRLHSGSAAYAPQLQLGSETRNPTVLHAGELSGAWRVSPRWQARAVAHGSYGTRNFLGGDLATDPGAPAAPVQPIPALTSLDYGAASLRLALGGALGPRRALELGARGFAEGGIGAEAGAALPMQRGVEADASLGWTLSRADSLSAAAHGTLTLFPAIGSHGATAALVAAWRHAFTPRTAAWVGAGPTWAAEDRGPATIAAGGEAGVGHRLIRPAVDASVVTRVAPVVDRITGAVEQRADLTANASWTPARRWLLSATTASGVVLEGPERGDLVLSAEARLGWSALRRWSVGGGLRWIRQDGGPAPLAAMDEWSAFLAVGLREQGRL